MSSTKFVGPHSKGWVALMTHAVAVTGAQGRSTALHLAAGSTEPAIGVHLAQCMAQHDMWSALVTPDMVLHHTAHGRAGDMC